MMALSWSLTLHLLFTGINGFLCPSSQTTDSHLLCLILQNTDVESKISSSGRDLSINNYCTWGYYQERIGCNNPADTTIDYVELEYDRGLNGTLNANIPWPTKLKHIDLEHNCM